MAERVSSGPQGASIVAEGASTMPESTQTGLIEAIQVARQTPARLSPNGVRFATFGDHGLVSADLDRMVQAVPTVIAAALTGTAYYFVPLALTEPRAGQSQPHRTPHDETMIAPAYASELAELAICHRNVGLPTAPGAPATEAVFISTRLLADRFSLAFEFFINVGHAFVDTAGVPDSFAELAWNHALADVRGETSHDAWETRAHALTTPLSSRNAPLSSTASLSSRTLSESSEPKGEGSASSLAAASYPSRPSVDERSRFEFLEAAFADAIAIYLLSLAVDFDYSELREREYPLLAPQPRAERLRHTARLFPPNPTYDFAIRYRRRT